MVICELWCLNIKRNEMKWNERRFRCVNTWPSHMPNERVWKDFKIWRWWNFVNFQTKRERTARKLFPDALSSSKGNRNHRLTRFICLDIHQITITKHKASRYRVAQMFASNAVNLQTRSTSFFSHCMMKLLDWVVWTNFHWPAQCEWLNLMRFQNFSGLFSPSANTPKMPINFIWNFAKLNQADQSLTELKTWGFVCFTLIIVINSNFYSFPISLITKRRLIWRHLWVYFWVQLNKSTVKLFQHQRSHIELLSNMENWSWRASLEERCACW